MVDFIEKELKLIERINSSLVSLELRMEKLELDDGKFRQFIEQEKSIYEIKNIVRTEMKLAELEREREEFENSCIMTRARCRRAQARGLHEELAKMERSIWCLMLRTDRLLRLPKTERPLRRLRAYLHNLENMKSELPDSINRVRLNWLRA